MNSISSIQIIHHHSIESNNDKDKKTRQKHTSNLEYAIKKVINKFIEEIHQFYFASLLKLNA